MNVKNDRWSVNVAQVNNDSVKSDEMPSPRTPLRITGVLIFAATVTTIVHFYLAIVENDPVRAGQLYWAASTVLGFVPTSILSFFLIRGHRQVLGAQLLIFSLLLSFLAFTFFIEGFGLTFTLAAIAISSIIAGQTLPLKYVGRTIVVSVLLSVAILLLDLAWSGPRASIPFLKTYIPFVLGLITLLFSFFVARQFANYSLRVKLIIAFLGVSILSVGTIALVVNWTTQKTLTEDVAANLKNIANTQALVIGDLLAQQVDILKALSLHRVLNVEVGLFNSNAGYPDDPTAIQTKLKELDRQWQAVDDTDLLVQSRLINVLATELTKFRSTFPDHIELFITNQHGALVAATNRTSNYYHADEEWWQAAYNHGQGATYIGVPEFDERSATFGVKIAVPVYAANGRTVIGILRTTYRLASLSNLLTLVQLGETGRIDIYLPNGLEIEIGEEGEIKIEPADFNPDFLAQLNSSPETQYVVANYDGHPTLHSAAPIVAVTGEPAIADLGWIVMIHQDWQEMLAPVQTQQNVVLLLTFGIAGATTIVAVVVAQLLVRPVSRLTHTAQQVAAGNLTARAQASSGDEIGLLAKTFNLMTEQLQETVDTLEERVADRTRQIEAVVDISQRLAGILDLSDLLRQVVSLTKERFDYYHVQIYLLDETPPPSSLQGGGKEGVLILTAGYEQAGSEMREQEHTISLNAPGSLVARAGREGKVISVENIRLEPDWSPNPLLPDTYSEMTVPVMLGAQVVGVLDVQSEKIGGLTQGDEAALQALANQIAAAIRNARLFTQTQEALYEAQRLQQLYTGQSWEKLGATHMLDYEFNPQNLPPLEVTPIPEAVAALQQKRTIDLRTPLSESESRDEDSESKIENPKSKIHTALATPLKLRDQVIGVLGFHSDEPQRRWTEDEIALIEAVSEQMSLAIENARLFEETGRRAGRERLIADATQQVWASGELERVMQTTVEQLGTKLDASRVVIRLGTEEQLLANMSYQEEI